MTSSRPGSTRLARSSANGGSGLPFLDSPVWKLSLGAGVKPAFPPSLVVQVKALACELPHRLGLPLSRFSIEEIRQHVISQGLVAEISGATLWRWLSTDALRPWQHRSWILPRDPNFAANAGPVLDLYERIWEGTPLGANDFVISADEKTSIQARRRKQPTLPPAPNRRRRFCRASMRPRPRGRGIAVPPVNAVDGLTSFNEATTARSWNYLWKMGSSPKSVISARLATAGERSSDRSPQ